MADSVGSISLDLELDHSNYDRELKQVSKGTQSNISSLSKGVGKALLGMFAVKGLVDFGKSCLKLGSDLAEVQNVVDVAFGSKGTISRDINNFAKRRQQALACLRLWPSGIWVHSAQCLQPLVLAPKKRLKCQRP